MHRVVRTLALAIVLLSPATFSVKSYSAFLNQRLAPSSSATRVFAVAPLGAERGEAQQREVAAQLQVLQAFNDDYLGRMRAGREGGKTPQAVQFERAQQQGADGIKRERETLKVATSLVASAAVEITLGIKADSGSRALEVLKKWVTGLSLVKGVLRAVDESNTEVRIDVYNDVPVFVKYNSSESGDAYMKPYEGGYGGVIFQPKLDDGEFRQYGDFPLSVF